MRNCSNHCRTSLPPIAATACLLLLAAMVGWPTLSVFNTPSTQADPVTFTNEPAQMADTFVDSIGVDTHLSYTDTPYGDYPLIEQALQQLRVRHIRDMLFANDPTELAFIKQLHSQLGITVSAIFDGNFNAPGHGGILALQNTLISDGLLPAISDVEGPNEWDNGYLDDIAQYQQELYSTWTSNPQTATIPVLGPSFSQQWNPSVFTAVGNLSNDLDYCNLHDYPGQGQALSSQLVAEYLANNSAVSGDKPCMATETGYSTALGASDAPEGNPPVSQSVAGDLLMDTFLESYQAGIRRTYAYELVDEFPNDNFESNFGLLSNSLQPKPAYTDLQNTIATLTDPGPTFSPTPLPLAIEAQGANINTSLFEKRNGDYYLALWNTSPIWDSQTQSPIAPDAATVTVLLPQAAAQIATIDPSENPDVEAVSNNTATYTLSLGASPVFVEISGYGTVGSITSTSEKPSASIQPDAQPPPDPTSTSSTTRSTPTSTTQATPSSTTSVPTGPLPTAAASTLPVSLDRTLLPGDTLDPGKALESTPPGARLFLSLDGALLLQRGSRTLWTSRTAGNRRAVLRLSPSGNLLLTADRHVLWDSSTAGHPHDRLLVTPHGVAELSSRTGVVIWHI